MDPAGTAQHDHVVSGEQSAERGALSARSVGIWSVSGALRSALCAPLIVGEITCALASIRERYPGGTPPQPATELPCNQGVKGRAASCAPWRGQAGTAISWLPRIAR